MGNLVRDDDTFAREGINELVKRCAVCQAVDIRRQLVYKGNRYWGFSSNDLLYIDQWNNFTRFGRERIRQVFEDLAKKFALS
ncbi:hypothetical protein COOONC_02672 [Cooperia oncophora]